MEKELFERLVNRMSAWCHSIVVMQCYEGAMCIFKEEFLRVANRQFANKQDFDLDELIEAVAQELYNYPGVCDIWYGSDVEDYVALDINFYTDYLIDYKIKLDEDESEVLR